MLTAATVVNSTNSYTQFMSLKQSAWNAKLTVNSAKR